MSKTNSTKHYFLERTKEFVECKLVSSSPYRRVIEILEGPMKGKTKAVHPEGAAWGSMYPRLHESTQKPTDAFIYKGRVLLKNPNETHLVPKLDESFRFQPFMSHVIDSVNSKENILLTGPTGVGKTSPVTQLAARCNQPLIRINFNGETRMADFIGKLQVLGGETKWVDGVLPMAMRNGYWLLLDEIDFADPAVLSLLHPVLEKNPHIVLKENAGEIINAHPNFRLFATANSIGAMQDRAAAYAGTNHMNEAFLDRFQVLMVPYLNVKEELKVVRGNVKGLKNRWAKSIVEFAHKVREQALEGVELAGDGFSTRRVLHWAEKSALLRSPIEGAKLSWLHKMASGEHEAILRILELHFGGRNKRNKSKTNTLVGNALQGAPIQTSTKPSIQAGESQIGAKRGRGRPKGSKNKIKTVQSSLPTT